MLVQACLNGNRPRDWHPALPITAAELAADAMAVVAAGAGAIHAHPRGPDGRESLEPDDVGAVVRAIRDAVPAIPLSLTTAAWIEPDASRLVDLIASWDPAPDLASVNLSEDGAAQVIDALLRRGIGVEAGLASVADARRLLGLGVADRCARFLVEVEHEDPEEAVGLARAIDGMLSGAGAQRDRLHHGFGPPTWPVIVAALARGRAVRIGLEDADTLPDGSRAEGNEQLVAEAVRLAGTAEGGRREFTDA